MALPMFDGPADIKSESTKMLVDERLFNKSLLIDGPADINMFRDELIEAIKVIVREAPWALQ